MLGAYYQIYTDNYSSRFYSYITPNELLIHDDHSTIEIKGGIFKDTCEIVGEIPIEKSILENITFAGYIYPHSDKSRVVISDKYLIEDWYAIDDYEIYHSITLNGRPVTIIKLNNFKPIDQNWIYWQKKYPLIFLILFIIGISIIYPFALKRDIFRETWYNISTGQLNKALLLLKNGLEINPIDTKLLNSKGYILIIKNEIEDAIQCLDKSISIDTKNAETYYFKGKAFHRIKNFDKAIECFNIAVDIKPDYFSYYDMACAYSMLGDEEKAIESFKHAITFDKGGCIEHSKSDIDLENLKTNPEFTKLLEYD